MRETTKIRGEQAVRALEKAGALWRQRLDEGWTPPEEGAFPWAQVRLTLTALVPGLEKAGEWLGSAAGEVSEARGGRSLLILAGNTPLMSWSPLAACLLAGRSVDVKMSRDETLWPRLFVEALEEVDPEVARRIRLLDWAGDDPRIPALIRDAETVIAFGSDRTIATLRSLTPETTPFFGYGHAVSVGVCGFSDGFPTSRFRNDIMMYEQSGCLSAQTIFVATDEPMTTATPIGATTVDLLLALRGAGVLNIPPVTDPAVAHTVREAADLAQFAGAKVYAVASLNWTVIVWPEERPMPPPVGHCVVHLIPVRNLERLPELFGDLRGRISSVGVAGKIPESLRAVLEAEGISRICPAGEMQTPPLDWPNGGFDLLTELLRQDSLPITDYAGTIASLSLPE